MTNWKKDGYKIGEKVFIVKTLGLSNSNEGMLGTVVYVGTKKLRVSIQQKYKESILEFDSNGYARGSSFGYYYYVYKTEEEYINQIQKQKNLDSLKKELINKIESLSLEQLNKLSLIIDTGLN